MPGMLSQYVAFVEAVNYRIGRIAMYGIFVMVGVLLWSSLWTLDVPVLFNQYGFNEIWGTEYSKVGVKHLSAGSWDPCHFNTKAKLTTIPDDEWATVEKAALKFCDEIAAESPVKAKVVDIFKKYNADMVKAGRPYRYGKFTFRSMVCEAQFLRLTF